MIRSKGLKKSIKTYTSGIYVFIPISFFFSRANELNDDCDELQDDLLSGDEYDVGQLEATAIESIVLDQAAVSGNANSEIAQDPFGEENIVHTAPETNNGDECLVEYAYVQYLDIERAGEDNVPSTSAVVKVELVGDGPIEENPFNVMLMRDSLDNSNDSDCMITAEYQVEYEADEN